MELRTSSYGCACPVTGRSLPWSLGVLTAEVLPMTTVCSQCDQPESKCACQKYCCFCQSQDDIRLCVDGLYYCPECREACDVRVADDERAS